MQDVMVSCRRKIALLLAALIAVAGTLYSIHDALTLALLVCAGGLIWSSREWRAWVLAAAMAAAGLFWSSIDVSTCSAWWRGRIVYDKLVGHLPYFAWRRIWRQALGPCYDMRQLDRRAKDKVVRLAGKVVDGRQWELCQTDLGRFWVVAPGRSLLSYLVWEMTVQSDYESDEVRIHAGDTVIDCGAHVGVFCRYALRRGAGRVVAIEPDPTNIACLEANLAQEIADGRVKVVKAGVWDRRTRLTLSEPAGKSSGAESFLDESPTAKKIEGVLVLPLDDIVRELRLDRVDFIKMDIEGAERFALQGAGQTIRRFKPRMAISAYHAVDDGTVIPDLVKKLQPTYQIGAKDVEIRAPRLVQTKVLFFH